MTHVSQPHDWVKIQIIPFVSNRYLEFGNVSGRRGIAFTTRLFAFATARIAADAYIRAMKRAA
ncbi:hypothetical protein [Mesorhizobium sp. J428]|uniref:hypothetical protein n=1 Tax=Mesorhizobium sp. J428 TaxID=2898440 RepID=UPI002151D465|nr:hypothetical protein [Mesorhizobium sp. J428]MCR5855309.1 hypothetical protein [Mesorhizobium sp. J428]